MDPADIRVLFAYDRWATEKVLDRLDGVEPALWGRERVVGKLPDPLAEAIA